MSQLWIDNGYSNEVYINPKSKPTANGYDTTVGFDTISSIQLQEWLDSWYIGEEDKKRVRRDLVLTHDTMLHWHTGDGSASANNTYISTNSFPLEDCEFLVKILERDVGVKSQVRLTVDGYVIALSMVKENIKTYLDYLAQAEDYEVIQPIIPWKFDINLSKKEVMMKRKKNKSN